MAEPREVFEMVTKQAEPDLDAWKQQEQRQRRTSRNRRFGAMALAAAIGIVAVVVVIRTLDDENATQPGGQGTGATEVPTEGSIPDGTSSPHTTPASMHPARSRSRFRSDSRASRDGPHSWSGRARPR